MDLSHLPKDIENIIVDYVHQLEHVARFEETLLIIEHCITELL